MLTYRERYRFKEFATGNVKNRNQIFDSKLFEFNSEEEVYSSHFSFDSSLVEHVKTTGSVKGFEGLHIADDIIFDFDGNKDASNLEDVRKEVIKFINYLHYEYEIDNNYLKIYFSGLKGFHIYIPIGVIDKVKPHKKFAEIIRRFVNKLTEGFNFVDYRCMTSSNLLGSQAQSMEAQGIIKYYYRLMN